MDIRRDTYIKMTQYINSLSIEELKYLEDLSSTNDNIIKGDYLNNESIKKQIEFLDSYSNLLNEEEQKEFDYLKRNKIVILWKSIGVVCSVTGLYIGVNMKRININKQFFLGFIRRGVVFGAIIGYFFLQNSLSQRNTDFNRIFFSVIQRNYSHQDVF